MRIASFHRCRKHSGDGITAAGLSLLRIWAQAPLAALLLALGVTALSAPTTCLAADDCFEQAECEEDDEEEEEEPWTLQEALGERLCCESPLNYGGWFQAGYTTNAHGNRTGNGNLPLSLNNVADTPVVNQLWGYLEKPLDMECNCVDWGFRLDTIFGADGPDMQAFGDQGWDYDWNTSRDYGLAIPQLYVELGVCDWVVQAGYILAPLGWESLQAYDNFFYTHNYAYNYGTAGTFSGVIVSREVSDDFEFMAGWSTSWDSWLSNHLSGSMFMGGFEWSLGEKTDLTYYVSAGDFGDGTAKNGADSNAGRLYAHSITLSYELSERTTYVFEHVLGMNTGLGADNNEWYSITNYLTHEINPCWAAGLRLEWFRDDDGYRVDTNGSGPGSFYEATVGLNWMPHSNVRVRPEARWDWFSGQGQPFDSRDGGNSGTTVHQFTGAIDVVITF